MTLNIILNTIVLVCCVVNILLQIKVLRNQKKIMESQKTQLEILTYKK